MPAKKKACIFCGRPLSRSNSSKEHVIARWIRKVPLVKDTWTEGGGRPRTIFGVDFVDGRDEFEYFEEPARSKGLSPFYATVVICSNCNSGWMSQELEAPLEPLLAPVINGTTSLIPEQVIPLLRRWAIKTAITFEQDDPTRAFLPKEQIAQLFADEVVDDMRVFVAPWGAPELPQLAHFPFKTTLTRDGRPAARMAQGSKSVFAFGALAILVTHWDHDAAAKRRPELEVPREWTELVDGVAITLGGRALVREDVEILRDQFSIEGGDGSTRGSSFFRRRCITAID